MRHCGLQSCPECHPIFHAVRSMDMLICIQYVNAACLSMDPNVHESSRNRFIPWDCIGLAQLFGYQCEKASTAATAATVKTVKMPLHPFAGKGPVRFLDRNDINALMWEPALHPIPVSWSEPSIVPTHHCDSFASVSRTSSYVFWFGESISLSHIWHTQLWCRHPLSFVPSNTMFCGTPLCTLITPFVCSFPVFARLSWL